MTLIDTSSWGEYFRKRKSAASREKGFTVPISDIIIAACAVTHGLELEHCDKHFNELLPLAKTL
jgi:predicted nucleic acid-binding protein